MAFKLDDNKSDIESIIAQLHEAEQAAAKLPVDTRQLLNRARTMLDECRSVMQAATKQLDKAALLRIGMMDSQSRADEVARQIKGTLTEQAGFFRSLLSQHTPRSAPAPQPEVI